MIARITVGKTYEYKGHRCHVESYRKTTSWRTGSVTIRYTFLKAEGDQTESVTPNTFRDNADYLEAK